MSAPATEENPVLNEWGHTFEDYSELWSHLSKGITADEGQEGDYWKYLNRVVAQYLFTAGHPDPEVPLGFLLAVRALSLAALRFLILEGYIELTNKGTRDITGEEVPSEGPPAPEDATGHGTYL